MESASSIDFLFLLIGGTLAFLVLAGSIVFFVLSYRRRMLKKDLEIKEQEALHQKDLFDRNLEATENERQRVARELHDEVGSSLSMMRLLSRGSSDDELSLRKLIDATIDNVRRISNDLLPSGLDEFGLEHALEIFFEKAFETSNIEIDADISDLPVLTSQQNLMVYRIIQELINNSIKYADTSHIQISIVQKNKEVSIDYQDFGKAFDIENALKKDSLGLKNLTARAAYLSGTAHMESSDEQGFVAQITFPINTPI